MGQKTNPNGFRFGVIRNWKGRWFAKDNKQWAAWAIQDRKIRSYLFKYEKPWLTGDIIIERTNESEINIHIYSAKPGSVLGQDGANVKKLIKDIQVLLKNRKLKINIDVREVENPDINAKIVANEIAISLENRGSFRMAQKKAIKKSLKAGAKGIKTLVSGRLNGVDMARSEGYSEGIVPLQTLRNDIDFAIAEALTTYGLLGIKVWISKGEVLKDSEKADAKARKEMEEAAGFGKKPFKKREFKDKKDFDKNSRNNNRNNDNRNHDARKHNANHEHKSNEVKQ